MFYKDFDLVKATDILVNVLKNHQYVIKETMFPMLILHVGISIERMLNCQFYTTERKNQALLQSIESVSYTHLKGALIEVEVIAVKS